MAYFRYANKLNKEKDPNSIVLLHFENDFVNDQITDVKGNTFTRSNSNITISQDSYFGADSLYMDDGNGRLQSQVIDSLYFGSGDFTIDLWVKVGGYSRICPIGLYYGGILIDIDNLYPRMWFLNEQGNAWIVGGDDGSGKSTLSIPMNEWAHIAYVRNGEYITIYVNGKLGRRQNIGNAVQWQDLDRIAVRLGQWDIDGKYQYNGYIDEVRIINKAVWTEEFTPPTAPYTN